MGFRSTATWRIGLIGLAAAGALAGSARSAAAQSYYYYGEVQPYPPAEAYGYGPRYGVYGYGYEDEDGYDYRPARPRRAPAAITPDAIGRIAFERHGLVKIERLVRGTDAYIVEGSRADGSRQRIVLDAYAGSLVRRQPLPPKQPDDAIARIDPREPARRAAPPTPPQRPAELKPQAGASAALPPGPPLTEPASPAPAQADAPAQAVPPPSANLATPSPGAADHQSGAPTPRLVNPEDVRAPEWSRPGQQPEAAMPSRTTAAAPSAAPATPVPATSPPPQGQDATTAQPKAEIVIPPVQPLD